MRLNKFLAAAGVASRRAADELIAAGRVRVDGSVVKTLGTIVDDDARVEVDRKPVGLPRRKTYVLVHKPIGVVSTLRDPQGRRTVRDLLPPGTRRLAPVGRLDYDTSGALLMTDDGDLAHRLLHPRFGVEKSYRATVVGALSSQELWKLRSGMRIGAQSTQPCRVRVLRERGRTTTVELTLHEGRNRQVRRMFDALGRDVVALQRVRFGPISLGELPSGATRCLSNRELDRLCRIGGKYFPPAPAGKAAGRAELRTSPARPVLR